MIKVGNSLCHNDDTGALSIVGIADLINKDRKSIAGEIDQGSPI